jgi:hypothetical protein
MAERRVSRTVELKSGEHQAIELGDMEAGEVVSGFVKDVNHDKFLFVMVDEANYKRFMEGEEEAEEDSEDLKVLEEGDGKGHYRIDAEIETPGKYFIVVESEAAAMKRTVKVELLISKPAPT